MTNQQFVKKAQQHGYPLAAIMDYLEALAVDTIPTIEGIDKEMNEQNRAWENEAQHRAHCEQQMRLVIRH